MQRQKDYRDAMALLSELKEALIGAQSNVDSTQKNLELVRIAYEAAQKTYQEAMGVVYTIPILMRRKSFR